MHRRHFLAAALALPPVASRVRSNMTRCLRTSSLVAFDLVRLASLAIRSSHTSLAAENLFLRKQLALFQERKVKPRRADDATEQHDPAPCEADRGPNLTKGTASLAPRPCCGVFFHTPASRCEESHSDGIDWCRYHGTR